MDNRGTEQHVPRARPHAAHPREGRTSAAPAHSRLAALVLFGLAWLGAEVRAAVNEATEYEVKAAFIYNFARFAEWPATAFERPTDPIRLCVLGADPFGEVLDETVRNKTVAQHPFVVARIAAPAKARDCHILYIGRSEASQLGAVLTAVHDAPVMTVVDMEGAARRGAILNFSMEDGRVRFAVNAASAKRSGLALSSQLIKLATTVTTDTQAQ